MSISKEEFDAAIADVKLAITEAIKPVVESVSVLAEAAKPAADAEGDAPTAVEIATKFNESGLPKVALERIAEAMTNSEKTVDELIESEKAYVASVTKTAAPATDAAGVIHEAAKTSSINDEFEKLLSSRIAK